MTNPTSNFGWQMPTSTDLVTDLPADFEVFGQAVDTDFVDLLGGTTGQVLSKTSATDLDFTWVTANPGDITGVTAGTGITGGGTSGTVTVTNDMATTITAAGDIVVGTGSGTYDNLPIGTTAQILTADTTVSPYKVKWATPAAAASGLTFITGASFSAVASVSAATSTFTSTYNCYKIIFVVEPTSANAAITMRLRTSGTDNTNSSYYGSLGGTTFGGASISVLSSAASSFGLGGTDGGQNPPSLFFDISNPQIAKITNVAAFGVAAGAATTQGNATFGGFFNATTQFDSVTFLIASGTMTGYYKIYGYQNS